MSRVRVTLVTALAGMALLTACSSASNEAGTGDQADKQQAVPASKAKPIKDLSQAHLTQALPGDGETLSGYSLHGDKSVTEGPYCNASPDADSAPAGWVRGSDSSYEYNGSTTNMAHVAICLFDSAGAAHTQFAKWTGTKPDERHAPKKPIGDENTLVMISDDSVYGYVRSGNANIRVRIEGGAAGDPSGTQAMLAATLERLQQLQEGKPATATAADVQAATRQ
ncbi:hypothetical protein [Streptomyces sp. NPDC051214]|uniref:hypothetical protein n=1 Tax=Streptomyces sp. NPDC051214 TaxID=3155282 RepID=UPI00343E34F5